ncbi:CoA transferase, partial [Xanthomonas citri pv. citri]|nr:CoA transferase [Xanthomonas citri pv. citri]
LKGLGLGPDSGAAADLPRQGDRKQWPELHRRFEAVFATRTRDEWAATFDGTDACAFPVLSMDEAKAYRHNVARGSFVPCGDNPDLLEP